MSRFGEYLKNEGVLDDAQLEEACRSQRLDGGRIGSILVELGYVDLDVLARHLSAYLGVRRPRLDWIAHPDEYAIGLIPNILVRRYQVLPMRIDANGIHVVMLDPHHEQQRALIEETARRRVEPYVLPERALLYWLERHYGIVPHPRYADLSGRVGAQQDRDEDSHPYFQPIGRDEYLADEPCFATPSQGESTPPGSETSNPASSVANSREELLLEEVVFVDDTPSQSGTRRVAQPSGPGEIAALELRLQAAGSRDDVIECGLRLASAFAPSAALFIARDGLIMGHSAVAEGEMRPLDGVVVPSQTASIYTQPAVDGQVFRGRPPHDGLDGRLLRAIGRPDVHEVVVLPVIIRGRVVNLLYADNGPHPLPDSSAAALHAVATTIAAAYERLILETKLGA